MSQSYSETSDAAGRIIVELRDDPPFVLVVCCLASVAPMFVFGEQAAWFTAAMVLVFGSLSTWSTLARRRMRVTIDASARLLALESGRRPRVLPFAEVELARLGGEVPGPRGPRCRVEVALRSGEVMPLYAGLGGFGAEDCRRMAGRINAALGQAAPGPS